MTFTAPRTPAPTVVVRVLASLQLLALVTGIAGAAAQYVSAHHAVAQDSTNIDAQYTEIGWLITLVLSLAVGAAMVAGVTLLDRGRGLLVAAEIGLIVVAALVSGSIGDSRPHDHNPVAVALSWLIVTAVAALVLMRRIGRQARANVAGC